MARSGRPKAPLVADKRYGPSAMTKAKPRRKSTTRRRRAGPKRRGLVWILLAPVRWALWLVWAVFWRATVAVTVIVALAVTYYAMTLPPVSDLIDGRIRGSVILEDRAGQEYAWRGDLLRGAVTADSVSPHLRNAVVAVEDKRFFRHFGISPRGIAGAVRSNLDAGRGPLSGAGGSTITQQTAKLLCIGRVYDPDTWETEAEYEADCRRTTLWRKAQEAVYALAMEVRYTKEEILTIYLNRAYLGAGARGFEAAAQRYFSRSAEEVTPAQAAMLAGLLKAPSTFAPTSNLERAQERADLVIGLMEEQGYLSETAARDARANPATLSAAARDQSGGWFADWVVDTAPAFLAGETTEDVIYRTTLDQTMQRQAEEALAEVFGGESLEGSTAEAAIVVMSADGAVRAMVGGRGSGVGAFNRATQAVRQPGSAFKPFIYAAALELGRSPLDMIEDSRLCVDVPGPEDWCPRNYSGEFSGPVTLTEALARSFNIPAARLYLDVGRDAVQTVASGFGIEADLAQGPAVSLGVSEVTLINLTGAYAGILNGGSAVVPYGLTSLTIRGEPEPLMQVEDGIRERIISEASARQLTYMMWRVIEDGTGRRARLDGREAAGKTGTTQASRDAWFVGFTGDYVVGVWMGNDDNSPLHNITGGSRPADIWREVMTRIHQGLPARPLPMDEPRNASARRISDTEQGIDAAGDAIQDALIEALQGRN